MTTREENELLTRTGPGTPGGDMMRRYWQPVGISPDHPEGAPPTPVRILGEDLVLFRDEQGRPGLLGIHCAHRGADLSYGRLEDGGLRCIYHGWLYDREGRCLKQPGEPAGSTFYQRVHQRAYPCAEKGGIIFAYLGPGKPPLLPAYDFLDSRPELRLIARYRQDCNYLQGNEGNLDQTHVSFLHRRLDPSSYLSINTAPLLEAVETDYGFRFTAMRELGGPRRHITVSNFLVPNASAFPGGLSPHGYSVHFHVPIDDERHWKYVYHFHYDRPLPERSARSFAREIAPDGGLVRRLQNRYLQDRGEMRSETFAGLNGFFHAEDACVTEGEGPIQDRSAEHLAYSDRGVVMMRAILLRAIKDVQEGRDPPHIIRDPAANHFPDIVSDARETEDPSDWRTHWQRHSLAPR